MYLQQQFMSDSLVARKMAQTPMITPPTDVATVRPMETLTDALYEGHICRVRRASDFGGNALKPG